MANAWEAAPVASTGGNAWEKAPVIDTSKPGPWSDGYVAPPIGQQPASFSGVAQVMGDQAMRGLGAAWENFSPLKAARALLPWNVGETAKGIVQGPIDAFQRSKTALQAGKEPEAAQSAVGMIPLVGTPAEQITRDIVAGKYPEAVGHAGGLAAMGYLPKVAGAAARVVPAAASAGGADIASGLAKGAAGYVASKYLPFGDIADALLGFNIAKSGVKQLGGGLKSAYQAGKAALTGEAPPAIPPPPAASGTVPTPEVAAPAAVAAPEPNAPVSLDDISNGYFGKPFNKLTTDNQRQSVLRIHTGIVKNQLQPVAPIPAPPTVAPQSTPPVIPAAQAPPPTPPPAPVAAPEGTPTTSRASVLGHNDAGLHKDITIAQHLLENGMDRSHWEAMSPAERIKAAAGASASRSIP